MNFASSTHTIQPQLTETQAVGKVTIVSAASPAFVKSLIAAGYSEREIQATLAKAAKEAADIGNKGIAAELRKNPNYNVNTMTSVLGVDFTMDDGMSIPAHIVVAPQVNVEKKHVTAYVMFCCDNTEARAFINERYQD